MTELMQCTIQFSFKYCGGFGKEVIKIIESNSDNKCVISHRVLKTAKWTKTNSKQNLLTDRLFWLNNGVGCWFAIDSIRMVLDLMFLLQRLLLLLVLDFFGVSHWCCYVDSIKRVMFKKKMVKRITLAQTILWPLSFSDVSLLRTASNWSASRSL